MKGERVHRTPSPPRPAATPTKHRRRRRPRHGDGENGPASADPASFDARTENSSGATPTGTRSTTYPNPTPIHRATPPTTPTNVGAGEPEAEGERVHRTHCRRGRRRPKCKHRRGVDDHRRRRPTHRGDTVGRPDLEGERPHRRRRARQRPVGAVAPARPATSPTPTRRSAPGRLRPQRQTRRRCRRRPGLAAPRR